MNTSNVIIKFEDIVLDYFKNCLDIIKENGYINKLHTNGKDKKLIYIDDVLSDACDDNIDEEIEEFYSKYLEDTIFNGLKQYGYEFDFYDDSDTDFENSFKTRNQFLILYMHYSKVYDDEENENLGNITNSQILNLEEYLKEIFNVFALVEGKYANYQKYFDIFDTYCKQRYNELKEKNKQKKNYKYECVVCLEKKQIHIICYHCNSCFLCQSCYIFNKRQNNIDKCPLCRNINMNPSVESVIRDNLPKNQFKIWYEWITKMHINFDKIRKEIN